MFVICFGCPGGWPGHRWASFGHSGRFCGNLMQRLLMKPPVFQGVESINPAGFEQHFWPRLVLGTASSTSSPPVREECTSCGSKPGAPIQLTSQVVYCVHSWWLPQGVPVLISQHDSQVAQRTQTETFSIHQPSLGLPITCRRSTRTSLFLEGLQLGSLIHWAPAGA